MKTKSFKIANIESNAAENTLLLIEEQPKDLLNLPPHPEFIGFKLERLPNDILLLITRFFSLNDLNNFRRLNKNFLNLSVKHSKVYWQDKNLIALLLVYSKIFLINKAAVTTILDSPEFILLTDKFSSKGYSLKNALIEVRERCPENFSQEDIEKERQYQFFKNYYSLDKNNLSNDIKFKNIIEKLAEKSDSEFEVTKLPPQLSNYFSTKEKYMNVLLNIRLYGQGINNAKKNSFSFGAVLCSGVVIFLSLTGFITFAILTIKNPSTYTFFTLMSGAILLLVGGALGIHFWNKVCINRYNNKINFFNTEQMKNWKLMQNIEMGMINDNLEEITFKA